ncbi:hypothetical protein OG884_27535 [Streptosporangium sp. NBC_01755]|uniref:hypothetical protein n=1 Tax=Streptosporangium sp. NBC_01755 TaxID=2975949 RepID=UPI002DDA9059|nr:hypothetical protein [Streptosporangium sp. NBC_01755]WSC98594.1 hypothetical protein OG884_27535 [Streptosporangium sp. NBC_01755]
MDIAAVSSAVALMVAGGAATTMGEQVALDLVERIRERIRAIFGSDERSAETLNQAIEEPGDENRIRSLAEALSWYARRDEEFAGELEGWARDHPASTSLVQNVHAGRDAYAAGRDMTVNQRPDP